MCSMWTYPVDMQRSTGSVSGKRLRRSPVYQKARETHMPMVALARQIGYSSLSSFYKAIRFEKMPEPAKLAKFGKFLGITPGEAYELWAKEMAR
jgi:AraC-like DNA-binding protein